MWLWPREQTGDESRPGFLLSAGLGRVGESHAPVRLEREVLVGDHDEVLRRWGGTGGRGFRTLDLLPWSPLRRRTCVVFGGRAACLRRSRRSGRHRRKTWQAEVLLLGRLEILLGEDWHCRCATGELWRTVRSGGGEEIAAECCP